MNTKELISQLKKINNKAGFKEKIETELNQSINHFNLRGYKVERQSGFVGKQVLHDDVDLFDYQYFRDVHFLYWGLNGNWNTSDNVDKIYYDKLREIIEKLYKLIK